MPFLKNEDMTIGPVMGEGGPVPHGAQTGMIPRFRRDRGMRRCELIRSSDSGLTGDCGVSSGGVGNAQR